VARNMEVQLKELSVPLQEVQQMGADRTFAQTGRAYAQVLVNGPEGLSSLVIDLTETEEQAVYDVIRRATDRYVVSLKTR
jgi:hypothetical protein